MTFAIIENDAVTRYPDDPLADHPETSFGDGWTGGVVNGVEYVIVQPSAQPTFDPMTQNVVEAAPVLVDGVWTQQWTVVAASDADKASRLAAWRSSASVTRFQALAALSQAGMLAPVQALMANPATPALAVLAWNEITTFERLSPTLIALATQLGWTDAQLDGLFQSAAGITA